MKDWDGEKYRSQIEMRIRCGWEGVVSIGIQGKVGQNLANSTPPRVDAILELAVPFLFLKGCAWQAGWNFHFYILLKDKVWPSCQSKL